MRQKEITIKSKDDIKRIRDAGKIISEIFKIIPGVMLPGMTTWDLDIIIEKQIHRNKAKSAFKTIPGYGFSSCISINNEVVHGIPSRKKIINIGDLVKIDIGVVLNGYFADACYTFGAGNMSGTAVKLVEAAHGALEQGILKIVQGIHLGSVGSSIEDFIKGRGFSIVRKFSGHGIGYALHEPPVVPHYGNEGTGVILEEGMVLTLEPIVNEGDPDVIKLEDGWTEVTSDGKLSAQFEHTIAVTRNGPMVLTD